MKTRTDVFAVITFLSISLLFFCGCWHERHGHFSKSSKGIVNSIGMEFVRIKPGSFTMQSPNNETGLSDENVQRQVKLTEGFYMQTTEVSVAQFARFIDETGYQTTAEKQGYAYTWGNCIWNRTNGASWKNPGFEQVSSHPVVCVSRDDANEFCKWLSGKEKVKYRLPTNDEWEYSCRAGTKTAYNWGDSPDGGKKQCNVADLEFKKKYSDWEFFEWNDGFVYTSPCGSFEPNRWGLYDMHGNVWEWCGDIIDSKAALRGGSWVSRPRHCFAGYRFENPPTFTYTHTGFRVLCEFSK